MDKIQWHPAFCSATELELRENKNDLIFDTEYHLSRKPLQMDMLDLSIDVFYKVRNLKEIT